MKTKMCCKDVPSERRSEVWMCSILDKYHKYRCYYTNITCVVQWAHLQTEQRKLYNKCLRAM